MDGERKQLDVHYIPLVTGLLLCFLSFFLFIYFFSYFVIWLAIFIKPKEQFYLKNTFKSLYWNSIYT